jgi:hypothetical protein
MKLVAAALSLLNLAAGNIAPCPGYTQSSDYKCDHDSTHRVCAQLVKNSHDDTPLEWGSKSFWEITDQKAFEWNDDIVGQPNPGECVYCLPIPRASCPARGQPCSVVRAALEPIVVRYSLLNSLARARLPTPRSSWCICMWATAELIEKVGCHNVHLRCESTDIEYVLSQYNDQGQKLDAAHSCLREKCGHAAKASAQATLTEA